MAEKIWRDAPIPPSKATEKADQFMSFLEAIKDTSIEVGVLSDGAVSVEFWDGSNIKGVADFYDDGGMVFVESGEAGDGAT